MLILTQFALRLAFGLSLAMALTSSRMVTSGYFRVHLYVVMGLNVLAAAVAFSRPELLPVWLPVVCAVLAYVGSVCWLLERRWGGKLMLWLVTIGCLAGAIWVEPATSALTVGAASWAAPVIRVVDPLTSGLVLGVTMAAMLLGHWYLNTPTMQLAPLKRLIALMIAVVALRALVSGGVDVSWFAENGLPRTTALVLLSLRWLAGIIGALIMGVMAWKTLGIPNTQSATGILYVGVITTFLGELSSQLLAADTNLMA